MADTSTSTDNTTPAQCAACTRTTNLKRCAKCQTTEYCSRECQKADWKNHKKSCSKNAASRSNAGTAGNVTSGQANTSGGTSRTASAGKPFTALSEKKWLHNRPEEEVYSLLIDTCRLRLEDDYKLTGDVDDDSIYAGAANGYAGFRRFLKQVEKKPGLLPDWWSPEKSAECEKYGRRPGWSNLNSAIEKSDIMEHYKNPLMPMQLRMFGEQVYGEGPGGQSGAAMMQMQMMVEGGGMDMHSTTLDASRFF